MSGDIEVSSNGVSISWKVFVAITVGAFGYYVATQIAPLRAEVQQGRQDLVELSKKVERMDLDINNLRGGSDANSPRR